MTQRKHVSFKGDMGACTPYNFTRVNAPNNWLSGHHAMSGRFVRIHQNMSFPDKRIIFRVGDQPPPSSTPPQVRFCSLKFRSLPEWHSRTSVAGREPLANNVARCTKYFEKFTHTLTHNRQNTLAAVRRNMLLQLTKSAIKKYNAKIFT